MKTYPLVEAVDSRPWVIRAGSGCIDPVNREMRVPLGSSGADRHVRAHEMAHVKITPKVSPIKQCKKFGVSDQALQVCEDLRVHSYLRHCGVNGSPVLSQAEADSWMLKADIRGKAAFLVASTFTPDFDLGVHALRQQLPGNEVDDLLSKVALISRRLHSGKGLYRPIGLRNCTVPGARLFESLFPEDADVGAGNGDIPLQQLIGKEMRGGRSVPWGEMKINKISPHDMRPISRFGQRKVFTDEGACLRAPYRLPVDGRVFVRKKRAMGGTILLDCSGSMHLKEQELHEILRAAPAATLAIYSARRRSGTLTIVGEKGKLASMAAIIEAKNLSGQSNVIDGPCLHWLAQQAAPRLWVSDGLVTGLGDQASIDLAAEAQNICRRGGIRRVAKASAVTEFLRESRPR